MKHAFCRTLLAVVMIDVRKFVSPLTIKQAWAHKTSLGGVEFHINKCKTVPGGFYWHGRACCLWEAKAIGWQTYFAHVRGDVV